MGDAGIGKEEIILVSELADEFALSATVAFTEGVEGIDFGEIVGEASAELIDGQVLEVFFGFKFGKNAVGFGSDSEGATEKVAFRDVDGADFTCPVINILEEILVNALEVVEIVVTDEGRVE